jgi:hypothetical protein
MRHNNDSNEEKSWSLTPTGKRWQPGTTAGWEDVRIVVELRGGLHV